MTPKNADQVLTKVRPTPAGRRCGDAMAFVISAEDANGGNTAPNAQNTWRFL
jgi:hypothetical protein